jgi:phosphoenolpyruvate-protein phosphotransferase
MKRVKDAVVVSHCSIPSTRSVLTMNMNELSGLPAAPGIAIGAVWHYRPQSVTIPRHKITDVAAELQHLNHAIESARTQLEHLFERTQQEIGKEEAAIFEAHLMFLDDPSLKESVVALIEGESHNAAAAVATAGEELAQSFRDLDDPYFQARATDIEDVARRLVYCLMGVELDASASMPTTPVIIVADDLTPSDTVGFDRARLLGFATVRGGPTSHTAILARTLGIPAVVSLPLDLDSVDGIESAVLDGFTGKVILNPSGIFLAAAQRQLEEWKARLTGELLLAQEAAVTMDGHRTEIVANIGNVGDARQAVACGAEGVGLLRTEFLFLDRDSMPDEAEQTAKYHEIFEIVGANHPLVVRTLDIGGDKAVSYLGFPEEQNPFLGWRAIRMMDRHADLLKTQFRALLRAGAGFDVRVMVPMVSTRSELEKARALFEEAKKELAAEGEPYCTTSQFGAMIEVPSAALIVEHLAPLVDFFSIGTNDLTQYTLAVDRTNERVAALASPYHPAVLRLIERVITEGHKAGKWVGLCGELAGDVLAVPLLLGLGLDEFSMAPAAIPGVKAAIRKASLRDSRQIAARALDLPSKVEVLGYLRAQG